MDVDELQKLAFLLAERNQVDEKIAQLIGRPAQIGHLGEFLASRVFDIELAASASNRGVDGWFRAGPLAHRSVNIKWYLKRENLIDLALTGPDFYLVLTGPRVPAASSRGTSRPSVIDEVFLFDAGALVSRLQARGRTIGIATSTRASDWEEARIFPATQDSPFAITPNQEAALGLFATKVHSLDRLVLDDC